VGVDVSKTPLVLGPPPAASVDILGIEATQAIQSLNNDVPLVRGKSTLVRVYFRPNGFGSSMSIQGEIAVSPSATSPAKYVGSMSAVAVSAAPYPDLQSQRRDIAISLNFLLPPDVTSWSGLFVTVNRIFSSGGDIQLHGNHQISPTVTTAPPLRVRAIGLR
jgi:hypothetical protein